MKRVLPIKNRLIFLTIGLWDKKEVGDCFTYYKQTAELIRILTGLLKAFHSLLFDQFALHKFIQIVNAVVPFAPYIFYPNYSDSLLKAPQPSQKHIQSAHCFLSFVQIKFNHHVP